MLPVKFKSTFPQDSSKPEVSFSFKCMKLSPGEYFCPAVCHHEGLSSKIFEIALVLAFNNAKNTGLGEGKVVVCKEPVVRKMLPPLGMKVEGRMQNKIKTIMLLQF